MNISMLIDSHLVLVSLAEGVFLLNCCQPLETHETDRTKSVSNNTTPKGNSFNNNSSLVVSDKLGSSVAYLGQK